jgi:hypothetical protein
MVRGSIPHESNIFAFMRISLLLRTSRRRLGNVLRWWVIADYVKVEQRAPYHIRCLKRSGRASSVLRAILLRFLCLCRHLSGVVRSLDVGRKPRGVMIGASVFLRYRNIRQLVPVPPALRRHARNPRLHFHSPFNSSN